MAYSIVAKEINNSVKFLVSQTPPGFSDLNSIPIIITIL